MKNLVHDLYGQKLRVRVCGILIENNKILLVRHQGLGEGEYLWIPPGGGMDYGSSAEENLVREYREETGLTIKVQNFLFLYEFLEKPLHALELFFSVKRVKGKATRGKDPEMGSEQIIKAVKYLSLKDIRDEKKIHLHQSIRTFEDFESLLNTRGYFQN